MYFLKSFGNIENKEEKTKAKKTIYSKVVGILSFNLFFSKRKATGNRRYEYVTI